MTKNNLKKIEKKKPVQFNNTGKQYNELKWFNNGWSFILIFSSLLSIAFPYLIFIAGPIVVISLRKAIKNNNSIFEKYINHKTLADNKKGQLDKLNTELLEVEENITNSKFLFANLEEEFKNEIRKELANEIEDVKIEANKIKSEATIIANDSIKVAQEEAEKLKQDAAHDAATVVQTVQKYIDERDQLLIENEKVLKQLKTNNNKLIKTKAEVLGIKTLTERFPTAIDVSKLESEIQDVSKFYNEDSLLQNLIELDCHYKNSKELRKEMTRNKREMNKVLDAYVDRYTTKANRTIYHLMVIGLQAELQNILYTLTYTKLEIAQENVRGLVRKYLAICADGNNSILPTITRFLSEIEPIFLEAIEVEYHYYVKRELEKEEQQAIREQIRQDAAERKALKEQQKKLEQEEEKFATEMNRNKELLLSETDIEKISVLELRIKELENQQNELEERKEEITKLANGKAGYVYVISNLGSFGENMFKIGMTRRLNPQERVDELGSASVPFKFDVHALIFSNDAVGLENKLHQSLSLQRVNKVNLRKEFFDTNIQELKNIVEEIDSTVEFKTTLVAQEYHQSLQLTKEQLTNVG